MSVNPAAEIAAKALDEAAKALRNLATLSGIAVGDDVTSVLESLPVGAVVRDRDGDEYRKEEDNFVTTRFSDRTVYSTISNYSPVKLVSLPTTQPAPAPFKIGDRVKISGISIYGGRADGQNGTVTNVATDPDEVTVLPDGFGQGYKIYRSNQLTPITTPASKNLTIERGRSTLRLEPSAVNRRGAFLHISEPSYSNTAAVHLTREDTIKLVASLQAIVEG